MFTGGNHKVHWWYTSLPEDKAIVRYFFPPDTHMQCHGSSGVTSEYPLCCVFAWFKILAMKKQTLVSLQNSKCFLLPPSQRCHLCSFNFLVNGTCY